MVDASARSAAPTPIVEAIGLTVAHGDQVVQQDINFAIAPAEIFVILGPSGSGKSSLLRDLIGLQRPQKGQVLIEGQDLYVGEETTLRQLRTKFSFMLNCKKY